MIEVAAFRRAFHALTPEHREVLVLIAVQGLSYEQVAEVCGCAVGTVKSRVNRARAMLKQMLLGKDRPDKAAGGRAVVQPSPEHAGRDGADKDQPPSPPSASPGGGSAAT
jgi:RNA polymerase sigma-70 factor (ECF subfamily)